MIERGGHRVFNPRWLFALESERRDEWQKPDQVIAALELAPSAVVADIGAGGGYALGPGQLSAACEAAPPAEH
jgi:hypothetical protein